VKLHLDFSSFRFCPIITNQITLGSLGNHNIWKVWETLSITTQITLGNHIRKDSEIGGKIFILPFLKLFPHWKTIIFGKFGKPYQKLLVGMGQIMIKNNGVRTLDYCKKKNT
jgi:hypothetical protein